MAFDLITALKNHQANAESYVSPLTGQRTDFVEGYLMAISHALELAKLQDWARRNQEGN